MLVVNDDPESCTEKVEGKGSKGGGSLVPGAREKRRSAWYTLFAHAFNLPKMWGLRAIF